MKLDKTVFKTQTFKEASDSHQASYNNMTGEEKSKAWKYLMSVAYGFVGKPWPKMDKTHFHYRKHK